MASPAAWPTCRRSWRETGGLAAVHYGDARHAAGLDRRNLVPPPTTSTLVSPSDGDTLGNWKGKLPKYARLRTLPGPLVVTDPGNENISPWTEGADHSVSWRCEIFAYSEKNLDFKP